MLLHQLALYNTWANGLIGDYILKASDNADIIIESSFPSIRKTLYHLWDAQVIWLARIKGESIDERKSKDFKGTLEEACKELIVTSKEITTLVETTDHHKEFFYHNLAGDPFTSNLEEIVSHVVNHGTYHRGQLITMLRQSGFKDVGSTDFIRFCRLTEVTK
jgi:uncharacterized damage-inducible protein DinB